MPKPEIFPFEAIKDSGLTLISRQQLPSGANITQATISTVHITVKKNNTSGTVTVDNVSLTVANVVFDSLQTGDSRWTKDDDGFNFLYEIAATAFPSRGYYRIELTFTPTAGEVFKQIWEGPALGSFDAA